MWLSLVEWVIWDHQVAGSNPVIPTKAQRVARSGGLLPALGF